MKLKKIFIFILILFSYFILPVVNAADDLFLNGLVAKNVRGLIKPVEKEIISSEIVGKINEVK